VTGTEFDMDALGTSLIVLGLAFAISRPSVYVAEQAERRSMTGAQSRQLKPGNRVCWQNDEADHGVVVDMNWAGVTIKWKDRGEQAILHNDMGLLERVVSVV
jgi:hypothetical protein